jgi:putative transposase
MTAHCYLDMLGELAITASHSRPRVSNDNPHSESLFKTVKYQPDYPRRFSNYSHANIWCAEFFDWYNNAHHHSSLGGHTPHDVFTGADKAVNIQRQNALDEIYKKHPNRFVNGAPKSALPAKVVYINPVLDDDGDIIELEHVNFPTLNRVKNKLTSA